MFRRKFNCFIFTGLIQRDTRNHRSWRFCLTIRCFGRSFPCIHFHSFWERTRHVVLDVIEHAITQVLKPFGVVRRHMEESKQNESICQSKVHKPPEQPKFPSFRKQISLTRTTTAQFYSIPPVHPKHPPIIFQGHLRCLRCD